MRRGAPPLAHPGTASTAAPPCGAYLIILSPRTRCPGLTESGSALRTSSSTLAIPAPLHRRHPDGASGLVTPSPPTSAHIVAERRHSAVTRYAERSAACRDLTRPCCRRAGGTPLLQSRCPTARAVTLSVNPRPRRGYMHRHTCAAERRRWHTPALHLQRRRPATHFPTASDHTLSARLK